MAATNAPKILAPNPDGIPDEMRGAKRWAPWRAEWNPKANKGQGKYEKIPHRADRPEFGLSNKSSAGWVTFDRAMTAYLAAPDKFSGVGYLMTGPHGVVGVDLDHCVKDGVVDEWAATVASKLDSYTEISPSGTGLHIMVAGSVPEDWMNHDQGIEIYGGNKARFLCITGARVPGTRAQLLPAAGETFDLIAAKYRTSRPMAEVEDLHLPPLIPVELLPDVRELDLPTHALNFFTDGPVSTDRSKELINAATALAQAGIERDEVLSILEANEHAIEVALDHRKQDYDSALRFLWKHSALAAEKRAETFKRLSWDQFDALDESEEEPAQTTAAVQGDAEDEHGFADLGPDEDAPTTPVKDLSPVKAPRFTPVSPVEFLKRKPGSWIIKGIVPRAGLAVIYGASGSGKTFLTLDMVGAIARGVPWRGATVQKGRVVYVVAEGASGFRNRLEAYCDFHGVDPGDFDIGVIADTPNIRAKEDVRALLEALKVFGKVDMVVIDTYARAMAGGNENDAKDVGEAIQHCDVIHRVTKGLVVLVHHSGKDATRGARGSGALRAAADLEIEVVQTREYRAATITKQKDGEDGTEYQFKLAEVVIGQDEEGEAITSCVVEHKEGLSRPSPIGKSLTPTQRMVMDTLRSMLDLGDSPTFEEDLRAAVLARIPRDDTKKRDNRPRDVREAIKVLIEGGEIIVGDRSALELANNNE